MTSVKFESRLDVPAVKEAIRQEQTKSLESALMEAKREIVERTNAGIDADGKSFAGYSPGYLKFKTSKGRGANVDLRFSGQMLASIGVTVKPDGNDLIGQLKFTNSTAADKALWNMTGKRPRKFFALSDEQVRAIKDKLEKIRAFK